MSWNEFLSFDFMKFFLPLIGAVIAWFENERRERKLEEYKRKEESYRTLLIALKGFYENTNAPDTKENFLEQLKLCWLYCPDYVIRRAYAFLKTINTTDSHLYTEEERELALGNFIASIRKDLLSRKVVKNTDLTGEDYKHYSSR